MRYIIIVFCLLNYFISFSQENYSEYHVKINDAEKLFFQDGKVEKCLLKYEEVFNEFDFIFIKDLLNAAQIAHYSNKPYRKYIQKAFEFGLKPEHLKSFPLFNDVYEDLVSDKSIKKSFKKKRKKYLKGIYFQYLENVYKQTIKDQTSKADLNYSEIVLEETEELIKWTKEYGFPGERIIGISDSTIFEEINKPELDLHNLIKENKKLWYLTSDELQFSQSFPIILLVHNPCAFKLYEDVLLEEIKKGNIHPRDVGLIYDNMYRYKDYMPNYCKVNDIEDFFLLNLFTEYPEKIDFERVNDRRKRLNICSLQLDKEKKEFEKKYGFKLFSGFWNCR